MADLPSPRDYRKFFTTHAHLTCLHSDFLLEGSIGYLGAVIICKDGIFDIFYKKNSPKIKKGIETLTTPSKFKRYDADFRRYLDHANKRIILRYSAPKNRLTRSRFMKDLKEIGKWWGYYGLAEFVYTDPAYDIAKKRNDKISLNNLDYLASDLKVKARQVLNAYFFKKGVLENILASVSAPFLHGDAARYLYMDELEGLFKGEIPQKRIIEERRRCYATAMIDGRIIRFSYKQALGLHKRFLKKPAPKQIVGRTAFPGTSRGRAVISPMLDDHKKIAQIDQIMKKGDILIAETTSPDTLVLCYKAAAIVAEQGGVLSHAAIVSRELKIPCIIGAIGAIKAFKTGDYIEVDATKGIVRKLPKTI